MPPKTPVGGLSVEFDAKVAKLNEKFDRVIKQSAKVEKSLDRMAKNSDKSLKMFGEMGGSVKTLVAGFVSLGTAMKAIDLGRQNAQFQDSLDVFNAMGQSLDEFRSKTRGLLSDKTLVQSFNLAENMGISKDTFIELANVADAAAKKTGQSQAHMFESLTIGVARQSRLWLDNLGIIVNTDRVYGDLAKKMGTTVKKLSDMEKRQAFTNEALRQGRIMMAQVAATGDSLGDTYDRLDAAVSNVTIALGGTLQENLQTVAKFMTRLFEDTIKFLNEAPKIGGFFKAFGIGLRLELIELLEDMEKIQLVGDISLLDLFKPVSETAEEFIDGIRKPLDDFQKEQFRFGGGGLQDPGNFIARFGIGTAGESTPGKKTTGPDLAALKRLRKAQEDLRQSLAALSNDVIKSGARLRGPIDAMAKAIELNLLDSLEEFNKKFFAAGDSFKNAQERWGDAVRNLVALSTMEAEQNIKTIKTGHELDQFLEMTSESMMKLADAGRIGEKELLRFSNAVEEAARIRRAVGGDEFDAIPGVAPPSLGDEPDNTPGARDFSGALQLASGILGTGGNIGALASTLGSAVGGTAGPIIGSFVGQAIEALISVIGGVINAVIDTVFAEKRLNKAAKAGVGAAGVAGFLALVATGLIAMAVALTGPVAVALAPIVIPLGVIATLFAVMAAATVGVNAFIFSLAFAAPGADRFNDAMSKVVDNTLTAFDPFWENMNALVGLFQLLMEGGLKPLIESFAASEAIPRLIFGAFVEVAKVAVLLGIAFVTFQNGLLAILGTLALAMGQFAALFGLGQTSKNLVDFSESLGDMAITGNALGELWTTLGNITFEEMRTEGNAVVDSLEKENAAREEVFNAPVGFLLAQARMSAIDPGLSGQFEPGGIAVNPAVDQLGGGAGNTTNIFIDNVNNFGMDDVDTFTAELQNIEEREGLQHDGSHQNGLYNNQGGGAGSAF